MEIQRSHGDNVASMAEVHEQAVTRGSGWDGARPPPRSQSPRVFEDAAEVETLVKAALPRAALPPAALPPAALPDCPPPLTASAAPR